MKATGVVRRIDNLGRIVIPKEIRKTLRIQNGDNLEIFMDENNNILLKKFSQIDKLNDVSKAITDAIIQNNKHSVFITNNDEFIAGSGRLKKNYLNKKISNDILNILNKRKFIYENNSQINLTDETFKGDFIISPIISSGDAIGVIIMLDEENLSEEDVNIVKIITNFLARHLED